VRWSDDAFSFSFCPQPLRRNRGQQQRGICPDASAVRVAIRENREKYRHRNGFDPNKGTEGLQPPIRELPEKSNCGTLFSTSRK